MYHATSELISLLGTAPILIREHGHYHCLPISNELGCELRDKREWTEVKSLVLSPGWLLTDNDTSTLHKIASFVFGFAWPHIVACFGWRLRYVAVFSWCRWSRYAKSGPHRLTAQLNEQEVGFHYKIIRPAVLKLKWRLGTTAGPTIIKISLFASVLVWKTSGHFMFPFRPDCVPCRLKHRKYFGYYTFQNRFIAVAISSTFRQSSGPVLPRLVKP